MPSLPVVGEEAGEGVCRRLEVPFEGPGALCLKDRGRSKSSWQVCMASAEKEYFSLETSVSYVDPRRIPLARTTTSVFAVHRFAIRDIFIRRVVSHILFVQAADVVRRSVNQHP